MDADHIDWILVSNIEKSSKDQDEFKAKRKLYEKKLEEEGLIINREKCGNLTFVKLKAPTNVLKKYCEIMKMNMPIKETHAALYTIRMSIPILKRYTLWHKLGTALRKCGRFLTRGDLDDTIDKFEYKAVYTRNKEYLFNDEDPNFFSRTIRILIVHHILNNQTLNNGDDGSEDEPFSLDKLLKDDVYEAAYPLHDGQFQNDLSIRGDLFVNWAHLKNWYKKQPIDEVQDYLGTKVAFYFAWLGFYTRSLVPPAFFGLLVIIYGTLTLPGDKVSEDTCNAENITMCPTCDYNCDYYTLSENCLNSKLINLFDNNLNVVFAFLMAIWASTFFELWKRYYAVLNYRWSLTRYSEDEEMSRPEYIAKVGQYGYFKKNIATGKKEPAVPFWKVKFPIRILSYTTLLFFIMLVIIAIIAVFICEIWITAAVESADRMSFLKRYGSMVTFFAEPTLNLISVMILDQAYSTVATYLTELELHRTQNEHETALHFKIFIFEFINSYSSIMYLAFVKGKFVGYPGHYRKIFGNRQAECDYGSCKLELSVQLAFIMIGKQIFGAIFRAISIFVTHIFNVYLTKNETADNIEMECMMKSTEDAPKSRWIEDYELEDWETVGLFPEYLKIVVQFGLITLFVPAFPLAPLFALINNILQIRLDSWKILSIYRKPIPYPVPGIGIWFNVLNFLGSFAVITNAILIAFSFDFVPRLVYWFYNNESDDKFLNASLSVMDIRDMDESSIPKNSSYQDVKFCYYNDMRHPPWSEDKYSPTTLYWQIFITRLIFVILFQNITYAIKKLIDYWIPDEPEEILQRIKRERYLTTQLIIENEAELIVRKDDSDEDEDENNVTLCENYSPSPPPFHSTTFA